MKRLRGGRGRSQAEKLGDCRRKHPEQQTENGGVRRRVEGEERSRGSLVLPTKLFLITPL